MIFPALDTFAEIPSGMNKHLLGTFCRGCVFKKAYFIDCCVLFGTNVWKYIYCSPFAHHPHNPHTPPHTPTPTPHPSDHRECIFMFNLIIKSVRSWLDGIYAVRLTHLLRVNYIHAFRALLPAPVMFLPWWFQMQNTLSFSFETVHHATDDPWPCEAITALAWPSL